MLNKNTILSSIVTLLILTTACSKKSAEESSSPASDSGPKAVEKSSSHQEFEGWMTSATAAFDKAKGEDRSVLILFTGSDWCPPCMMMEKEVINTREFKQFASKNLVLLLADFPQGKVQSEEQKAANESLAKKYDVEAFPTIILVGNDGKVLWRNLGYLPGGPAALIENINKNNQ